MGNRQGGFELCRPDTLLRAVRASTSQMSHQFFRTEFSRRTFLKTFSYAPVALLPAPLRAFGAIAPPPHLFPFTDLRITPRYPSRSPLDEMIALVSPGSDVFVTEKETQVFVHEGEVAVSSLAMPQAPVILSPGERTRVQSSQPPEPPSHFQPGRNNETFNLRPNDDGTHSAPPNDRNMGGTPPGQPGNQPGNAPGQGGSPPPSRPGGTLGGRPPEELLQDND